MKLHDKTGMRFGKLVVVELHCSKMVGHQKRVLWRCLCDCGRESIVHASSLSSGYTNSCGCIRVGIGKTINLKHGEALKTKEYKAWAGAKSRCFDHGNHKYKNYGMRGITMCNSWLSYENFLRDMGRAPTKQHSLDRIDVNGNYEPGNCRWATSTIQANNKQNSIRINYNGDSKTMAEMASILSLSVAGVHWRIKQGYLKTI